MLYSTQQAPEDSRWLWRPTLKSSGAWQTRILGVGPDHGLLEDTKQGGVISKLSRTDLVGLLGKLVYVIELELFCCNRLGSINVPCALDYIKRGRCAPPCTINHTKQSNVKATRRTGYRVLCYIAAWTSSAYVKALQSLSWVTQWCVASHQTRRCYTEPANSHHSDTNSELFMDLLDDIDALWKISTTINATPLSVFTKKSIVFHWR
jgi:hypothetical protein